MQRTRKLTLVVGVIAVAAATGHVMQDGNGRQSGARVAPAIPQDLPVAITPVAAQPPRDAGAAGRVARASTAGTARHAEQAAIAAVAAAPPPVAAPVVAAAASDGPEPARHLAALTGAAEVPPPLPLDAPGAVLFDGHPETVAETLPPVAEATGCDVALELFPQPGAMLDLAFVAPCAPNARVVIRHAGLAVTGQTSASGSLVAVLPAFADPAEVSVALPDGTLATARAEVSDLALYDRFAVQWMGADAFQLHAFEGAAGHGDPGHVSAVAPGRPAAAGGFLMLLGTEAVALPLLAEVYTYPAGLRAGSPAVRLDLEAAVTPATCGRELIGETIALMSGSRRLRELTVAMPDCDGTGGYVLMPEPFEGLQVAAN